MYGKNALIVDDSRTARLVLKRQLDQFDVVVESACDGNQALELLHSHIPDVIFLDHIMPGLDGFEVLARLKSDEATRGIPVVMYTSQAAPRYTSEARALGAVAVIPKNVTDEQLMDALNKAELYQLMAANEMSEVRVAAASGDAGAATVSPEPPLRSAAGVSGPSARARIGGVSRIGNPGDETLPEACNDALRPDRAAPVDRGVDAPLPGVSLPGAAEPRAAGSVVAAGRRNWLVPVLLCALLVSQGVALSRDNRQQQVIAELQQRVEWQARTLPEMRSQLRTELREGRDAASRQVEFLMSILLNQLREEQRAYRVNSAPEAPGSEALVAGSPAAEPLPDTVAPDA
ncbi:MAG: response regulator [Halioglobus sp.]|nr:response regulator [Halioglobus sp.]